MENTLAGRPLKRFIRLLSLEKREIGHIYLYAVFQGIIYLSLPLGIQAIISLVLANELSSSWGLLVVIVTLGTLVVGGLQLMQLSISERIQQKIFARASFEFAYRIPKLKTESLTNYYPPELVNRFFDTLTVQKGLPKILIDLTTSFLQMLFGLILLSFYHPMFIAFGLVLMVILGIIIRLTGPRGLATSLRESDKKYQLVFWLEEIARTMSSFKLAGDTSLALRKADKFVSEYLTARKQHFRVLMVQFGNAVAFKTLVTAGLLILGSVLLIQRQLNVGQFVASEIVIILIIASVEKLILGFETIYDVLTGLEKIGKITDLPLENHEGTSFDNFLSEDGISLRVQELSFQLREGRHGLAHISFHVRAGEKICIAGHSGAGKTILLHAISGLYENYRGSISYNQIPLQNLDKISLRNHIGDCLSQKNLFRGSLEENLHMGKDSISMQDVLWSLDRLRLTSFMQSLPQGLQTAIIPDSAEIPEGLARKLILARCLAKRPQMLVMDDFFSLWEKEDRQHICDFLTCDEMKTVIAVSNEKMFAQNCDRIIILEEGQIRDIGTYEEIKQEPYFDNLFQ
ncbi:MAG: ABC transporter ATP-binding protein [Bacteroidota bacterium]